MAFFSTLISTLIKMAIIAFFAFLGILTVEKLRDLKNGKTAAEEKE